MKLLFFTLLITAHIALAAPSTTVRYPIDKSFLSEFNSCKDSGDEQIANFQFVHSFSNDPSELIEFYWKSYKDLHKQASIYAETGIPFENLFGKEPRNSTKVTAPRIEERASIPRSTYDFKKTCAAYKDKFNNTQDFLKLTLSYSIGEPYWRCYSGCYKDVNFKLSSEMESLLHDGTTIRNKNLDYMNYQQINIELDPRQCSGKTVPECDSGWG